MIEGRTIKFGNGTVAVGGVFSDLTFTAIKPPQEIGSTIMWDDAEIEKDLSSQIRIDMGKHFHELKNKMKAVQQINDSCVVVVAGYIFDFNTFNPKSVDIILDHATHAYREYIRLCAV